MTIQLFLESLDVLPSAKNTRDISKQIRITAYTAALQGEGLSEVELDRILTEGLKRWKFYPTPAEILDVMRSLRYKDYRKVMVDNIAIERSPGVIGIVSRNSPEGMAELERREQEALPSPEDLAVIQSNLKVQLEKMNLEFPATKKIYEERKPVIDPVGEAEARAQIEAQKEALK